MGCVCSGFASCFELIGKGLSALVTAAAQLIDVLIKGIFDILAGLCTCLAGWACCCRPTPSDGDGNQTDTDQNVMTTQDAGKASSGGGWFSKKTAVVKEEVAPSPKPGFFKRLSSNKSEKSDK